MQSYPRVSGRPDRGESKAQDFPLVIHEPERLAKLVFLNQLIDEG
jgi:hypothetical protein